MSNIRPLEVRRALLAAIRAYQRFVSPHKGFCCAYRRHTGRASCSVFGYRAVRHYGVFAGLALVRRRTYYCGVAHRRYGSQARSPLHRQRGLCDIGCDLPCDVGCDVPSLGQFCDLLSCCDCGSCDWPARRSGKRAEREKYVYIPANSGNRRAEGHAQRRGEACLPCQ